MPHDGKWWTIFADPALNTLTERGGRNNTSIQQAAARLAQAQALVQAAAAAQWPQFGASTSASQQTGPLVNAAGVTGTLFNIGANLSYEVDFLQRASKAENAAKLDAASREALLNGARLLAETDIAQTYFLLREIDEEIALLQSTIASYRETLELREGGLRSGLTADLSVARARAELGAVESDALVLERRRSELDHALAYLIGETPEAFHLQAASLPTALPSIPAGIPASLLARRPDVRATGRAMEAAEVRLGIAQTAWFPSLTLTSSGGYASSGLDDLLKSSAASFGVAGLLALPILDGGRRDAAVKNAGAELEFAQASHRERILVALREVEDQLAALRILAKQAGVVQITVDADARVTSQLESRFDNGLASQLEVLDARRTQLKDRRIEVQIQSARYAATVGLIRALGGGWEVSEAAASSD